MHWPFERIPNESWTRQDLEQLALGYDTVEEHGWYDNLDRSVDQLAAVLAPGQTVLDYSGGTGILARRLVERLGDRDVGVLIVDSSPKFLRLALDKLGDDPRLAFRLIPYLREEKRIALLQEVLPEDYRVDAIVSTNAVHLYYGLEDTLRSWYRMLRPGGKVFVQSGNIDNPGMAKDEWIIDATVHAIHQAALQLVAQEPRWSRFADPPRLADHDRLRNKFFLPVRPLSFYEEALQASGFGDLGVTTARIEARVEEWFSFLSVYHEGVLGWAGGSRRVEGVAPDEDTVAARLLLMREAMDVVFDGAETFPCCWTYLAGNR